MAEKKTLSDNDVKISDLDVKQVKEDIKAKKIADSELTQEETERVKQIFKEVNAPIEFTDNDFKLGPGEFDIRKLSDENFKQLLFRQQLVTNLHLNSISQSLVDIQRLLFTMIRLNGCSDVVEEIDKTIKELDKQYGRANSKQ